MMAGNPSWWSMQSNLRSSSTSDNHQEQAAAIIAPSLFISTPHDDHSNHSLLPSHQHYLHGSSPSSTSSSLLPLSTLSEQHVQEFPHSWSQLLLGGVANHEQEERFNPSLFQSSTRAITRMIDVKQEDSSQSNNSNSLYGNQYQEDQHQEAAEISNRAAAAAWTQIMPASSPKSCVTSLSSNNNTNTTTNSNSVLDFSTNKRSLQTEIHQHADHTNSECNSTATGGVPKKSRVQPSSNPPLKVRKEKLGDRITALHQLVSPFGKTDTASVLLEAIGYIRFLQGQIEALSSPYLGNSNPSANNPHSAHGERNCLFPDHPGQLLNDSCMKRREAANQENNQEATVDLKTRGLCLVPLSCTQLVGSDNINGADYWAQSLGGGF